MSLPIPSEDDIVERVRSPKEQIGVWDKTTATLEKNMEKALEAMASYRAGKLHDASKFSCAFFKVANADEDLIALHFKVGGMMIEIPTEKKPRKSIPLPADKAESMLKAWDSYIKNLKIDQDDFAKAIHQAAIAKAKPKPRNKGVQPACHFDEKLDMWVMDE